MKATSQGVREQPDACISHESCFVLQCFVKPQGHYSGRLTPSGRDGDIRKTTKKLMYYLKSKNSAYLYFMMNKHHLLMVNGASKMEAGHKVEFVFLSFYSSHFEG